MRPQHANEIEPIPPTLRDGEPRRDSQIVPKIEPAPASVVVRRSVSAEIESIVEAATSAFARSEVAEAHRAIQDALTLLPFAEGDASLARAEVAVGRCLVGLGLPDRALAVLDAAERHADLRGDLRTRGRALQVLGHALWALGDPSCRAAFEDAGSVYEELGDEGAMVAIDRILRDISLVLTEESPRSFQGGRRA